MGLIYEATEHSELWAEVLKEIAGALHSNLAALVTHDLRSFHGAAIAAYGADPKVLKAYEEKFGHLNIYVQRASARIQPGQVGHGGMLCTDEEVLHTEYYDQILRPNDWFYVAGGTVAKDNELISLLSVQRPRRKGQYTSRDLALLRVLMPHMERGLRIQQRFQVLQSGITAIDSLSIGVLTVTALGKILLANEYARKIINENDGLSIARDGILTASRTQKALLNLAISEAAKTSVGCGLHPGHIVNIERPSGKRSYHVIVNATHSAVLAVNSVKPAAIIFITDPETKSEPPNEILRRLFGLTAAEARVAILLARGMSLEQTCEQLSIRYNTVHTHLRAIFNKMDVRRQSELVALVHRSLGSLQY